MVVTAYPVANKRKSQEICLAFIRGCGGQIGTDRLRDGAAVFYGVDASNESIWRQVKAQEREFYVIDNSYFDSSRQQYFRVTKNALQHSGIGTSDGQRFFSLGIPIQEWKTGGKHIVVCPQSDSFMRVMVGAGQDWMPRTLDALSKLTKREIRVRAWSPDKGALSRTLVDDLEGAHALVTWSSAAAVTAVLAGVPVVTLGQCAAEPMAGGLHEIEWLPKRDRVNWAGTLADNQWTLSEMKEGKAWSHLQT